MQLVNKFAPCPWLSFVYINSHFHLMLRFNPKWKLLTQFHFSCVEHYPSNMYNKIVYDRRIHNTLTYFFSNSLWNSENKINTREQEEKEKKQTHVSRQVEHQSVFSMLNNKLDTAMINDFKLLATWCFTKNLFQVSQSARNFYWRDYSDYEIRWNLSDPNAYSQFSSKRFKISWNSRWKRF